MPEERLTYRAAGVDIEANNEANERIKSDVRRTHTERVLTQTGLFGGALSLHGLEAELAGSRLVGSLGFSPAAYGSGEPGGARARRLLRECRAKLPPSARPLAFLDYLAAEHLHPLQAEMLVRGFADGLTAEPAGSAAVPLIGGETAEMPSTFRRAAWEVVGALYGIDAGVGNPSEAAGLARLSELDHAALVFTMDGVGTKTRLAVEARRTEGLALDIVHHGLNDILCQGAEGLGLLFYLGCHRAEPALVDPLLDSVERICRSLGIALLERAVAEKPDLYLQGEYDVCASLAGSVDARFLMQGAEIAAGDVVLGLDSSGLHTNGYSLARRALLERGGLQLAQRLPELEATLGEVLLAPHRNYAPAVLPLLRDPLLGRAAHGVAHITGGGLRDNLARILPPGLAAEIRLSSWDPPALFRLIQRCGNIPDSDPEAKGMYESFNMGIGLVLIADPVKAEAIQSRLRAAGEITRVIGHVDRQPSGSAHSSGPRSASVHLVP